MTKVINALPTIAFDLSGIRQHEAETVRKSKVLTGKLTSVIEEFLKADESQTTVKISRKYHGERQSLEFTATKEKLNDVVTVFLFSKK